MRIAVLQTVGRPGDVDANLLELEQRAAEARVHGTDLLITPELFLTGYNIGAARLTELAATDMLSRARRIATQQQIGILLGAPELGRGGMYNSAYFIGRQGDIQNVYRKAHLFGEMERDVFLPGDHLFGLVEFEGCRVAVMICYDVEFPEAVRSAASVGAHLIAVPTAQMEPYSIVPEVLIRARAWENQVYVAYANHDGEEYGLEYVGRSLIVAPDGAVMDQCHHGSRLLYGTVEPGHVKRQQRLNPYLHDRRHELYGTEAMPEARPPVS